MSNPPLTVKRRRRPWPRTPLIPPPAQCQCLDCRSYRVYVGDLKTLIDEAAQMAIREGPQLDCE